MFQNENHAFTLTLNATYLTVRLDLKYLDIKLN